MAGVSIEFDYSANNTRAKFLLPVIEGWHDAIVRYAAAWKGQDAPYCNNERANVGLLAGGAWLAGWSVLEEYPNPKKRVAKRKHSHRPSGRVDLYVRNGRAEAVFEAKQHALSAATAHLQKRISFHIHEAVESAREETYTKAKFGCVFFVPYFPPKTFADFHKNAAEHIASHVEIYANSSKADLWAWCFPELTRWYKPQNSQNYCPGVILAIKKA